MNLITETKLLLINNLLKAEGAFYVYLSVSKTPFRGRQRGQVVRAQREATWSSGEGAGLEIRSRSRVQVPL